MQNVVPDLIGSSGASPVQLPCTYQKFTGRENGIKNRHYEQSLYFTGKE